MLSDAAAAFFAAFYGFILPLISSLPFACHDFAFRFTPLRRCRAAAFAMP